MAGIRAEEVNRRREVRAYGLAESSGYVQERATRVQDIAVVDSRALRAIAALSSISGRNTARGRLRAREAPPTPADARLRRTRRSGAPESAWDSSRSSLGCADASAGGIEEPRAWRARIQLSSTLITLDGRCRWRKNGVNAPLSHGDTISQPETGRCPDISIGARRIALRNPRIA